jgi:S1-C subfamily serine protease
MAQKAVYQLSVRQIFLIALLSAGMAIAGVLGFNYFSTRLQPTTKAEEAGFATTPLQGISDPSSVSDEQNNIEVYRTVAPGVAFIRTTSVEEDVFGNLEEGRGSGSGSVIDANGHILTNEHVVRGARQLSVTLGGKVYPAKPIGADPDTDLAVIKIDAPGEALTVIPFGNAEQLVVGQKVLAIGNPFGFDRTLTTGVISGLQRTIRARNGRPIEGAVQTDASINPGNSGGPLLDSRGRMIGINSQILTPGGGSVGVGFAVSVDVAKRVVPQLLQFGEVRRPKLGVNALSVEQLRAQGIRMPLEKGLFLRSVIEGGAAERAGLRGLQQSATGDVVLGDIVTSIDGEAMEDLDDLYRVLDRKQIGETIQVEVFRDNKRTIIPVRLQALPPQPARPTNGNPRRF